MYPSAVSSHRIADGIVHAIGLIAIAIGGVMLLQNIPLENTASLIAAVCVYLCSVVVSFAASLAYHLLPYHHWRLRLRRIDHAAIYAFIAGTFTPLLIFIGTQYSVYILIAVWILAVPACAYKIWGSQVEPRWSLASYLALGWMGLLALPDFIEYLPRSALIAILCGGLFYTVGTIFYARKQMAYRYAIWHSFGLFGGASFFMAIWFALVG